MKKTYFAPETEIVNALTLGMTMLSMSDEKATGDPALVREDYSLDIWGTDSEDDYDDINGIFGRKRY